MEHLSDDYLKNPCRNSVQHKINVIADIVFQEVRNLMKISIDDHFVDALACTLYCCFISAESCLYLDTG